MLLVGQRQQRGFTLGAAIGLRRHRSDDQAVAVLDQRMVQTSQLRLGPVALLVWPRIPAGGRFMRLVGAPVAVDVRARRCVRDVATLGQLSDVSYPALIVTDSNGRVLQGGGSGRTATSVDLSLLVGQAVARACG